MAAKSRTKRKPTSKARPEEKPWQPVVKPSRRALELMRMRDRSLAILERLDDEAVLAIALALPADSSAEHDPVCAAAADVVGLFGQVSRLTKIVDDQRSYIMATGSDKRGRISSLGSCAACSRDVACTPADRLKAGYCSACYMAWARAGRPDRLEFARDRYDTTL